ncbi:MULTISPECIES: cupin domain-containing protein [Enterobacteriaceae]|uniref:(R)-mandelonitrile lyase n=1 Tax=Enterobacteriaceae TaxID=543 RepID=UPI003967D40A
MRNILMVALFASVVISDSVNADDGQDITVTPAGTVSSEQGSPDYFTGHVIIDLLTPSSLKTPASSGLVTFAPGARTAWHIHPAGQMLIVRSGKGWIQKEGQAKRIINPGDVVWIPAGVKHWHGATDTTGMSHIAVTYLQDGKGADWLEPVSDQEYSAK